VDPKGTAHTKTYQKLDGYRHVFEVKDQPRRIAHEGVTATVQAFRHNRNAAQSEYAGSSSGSEGDVTVNNCRIKMDHCVLRDNARSGVHANSDSPFADFSDNTITTSGDYPILIAAQGVRHFWTDHVHWLSDSALARRLVRAAISPIRDKQPVSAEELQGRVRRWQQHWQHLDLRLHADDHRLRDRP